jgi:N-acetylneuraminate synthase
MIKGLIRSYPDRIIGYSDHTIPDNSMLTLTAAYLKGAVIIEKHFTYDKTLPGNDHYHAMDVNDLKVFVKNIEKIRLLSGQSENKKPLESEEISRKNARRSIVAGKDIKEGEILSEDNLTYKRPAYGISPLHWDTVIGRKALKEINEDSQLQWRDFE